MSEFAIPTPEQAEWFMERLTRFSDNQIEEIYFNHHEKIISYTTSYEDYCMGCHMGTERESFRIPYEVFFSDASPATWLAERAIRLANEKKAQHEKNLTDQKRITEQHERAELARLARKYNEEA